MASTILGLGAIDTKTELEVRAIANAAYEARFALRDWSAYLALFEDALDFWLRKAESQ